MIPSILSDCANMVCLPLTPWAIDSANDLLVSANVCAKVPAFLNAAARDLMV